MSEAGATAWAGRRVVIVHDWLTGMRGGEKVLESICRIFPDAELLTLVHTRGAMSPLIESRRIRRSLIQWLPWATRYYRQYLPLFPAVIEGFDLDAVDLVISTSHCAAKAVVPTGRALHICYCHSPMRYGWDQFDAYFGVERVGRLGSAAARPIVAWLARWDRATAPRVHRFVANSDHVATRIARYYNRRSSVLHPPVDTGFFTPGDGALNRYFLVVSALVPYKRIDVAIRAAERVGRPLTIVGTGPDEARLRAIAGPTVTFAGTLGEAELRDAYRGAAALVLPGEEDFGLALVESLACGRPVIALGRGGARETVTDGLTGVLVNAPTVDAFAGAMTAFETQTFDPVILRDAAERFGGVERFERAFRHVVADALASPRPC